MEEVESKVETVALAPREEPARRNFFKTAFLTAAGLVVGASMAETADAQNVHGGVRSGDINVIFAPGKITVKDITGGLAEIVTLAGCTGCGMLGIDINFLRGDPVLLPAVQLPAVQSIIVTRGEAE